MIQPERITFLNDKEPAKKGYVLYWMQASQRVEFNFALQYAVRKANEYNAPLIVFFSLMDNYPDANIRHYKFMLQGLNQTQRSLLDHNIKMIIHHGPPVEGCLSMSKNARLVITDMGYLKHQRAWLNSLARKCPCQLIQIESDVVVPIRIVSNKQEYAAATIRNKIKKHLPHFLKALKFEKINVSSANLDFDSFDISDTQKALQKLNIDKTVPTVDDYIGGASQAKKLLKIFISQKLANYDKLRNDPNKDSLSNMSPYLHFGQISPVHIALEVARSAKASSDAYLEELIIRRELSMNFVFYNEVYDDFKSLPGWAKQTFKDHEKDERKYCYTKLQLENAKTHDIYWNAAQNQMVQTGKMHGYMRMYWGKKIIEWTKTPETAFKIALYLNNKYELDGRDPNSFTGVAWCFGKHDRPWKEREIFGKVRYMNDAGLKRKFDADEFAQKFTT